MKFVFDCWCFGGEGMDEVGYGRKWKENCVEFSLGFGWCEAWKKKIREKKRMLLNKMYCLETWCKLKEAYPKEKDRNIYYILERKKENRN